MSRVDEFYLKYLGVNRQELAEGERIFSCPLRGTREYKALDDVHHLIVSVYKDSLIHSINPAMIKAYRSFAPKHLSENLLELVDKAFCKASNSFGHGICYSFKYSIDASFPECLGVTVLTARHRRIIEEVNRVEPNSLFTDEMWKILCNQWIKNATSFAVIKENMIVSYSVITDFHFGAVNIVVWTHPEHRENGYGSMCVRQSVNRCNENNWLPIFMVTSLNTASIGLAEKLGFRRFSKEIITTNLL